MHDAGEGLGDLPYRTLTLHGATKDATTEVYASIAYPFPTAPHSAETQILQYVDKLSIIRALVYSQSIEKKRSGVSNQPSIPLLNSRWYITRLLDVN